MFANHVPYRTGPSPCAGMRQDIAHDRIAIFDVGRPVGSDPRATAFCDFIANGRKYANQQGEAEDSVKSGLRKGWEWRRQDISYIRGKPYNDSLVHPRDWKVDC